mgnify:CR=1 FL=1
MKLYIAKHYSQYYYGREEYLEGCDHGFIDKAKAEKHRDEYCQGFGYSDTSYYCEIVEQEVANHNLWKYAVIDESAKQYLTNLFYEQNR